MPWDIRRNYGSCSGYAVVKESDGSIAGCHETREKAGRQIAALEASEAGKSVSPEFEKYRGELYAKLTEEEKAFHDALLSIAEQYGPFDLGTSSIWVGYVPASENDDAEIGVMCSNCSFFNPENNGCAILSYTVEPMAICRLAAIPDGLVTPEMDDDMEDTEESMDKQYTGCGCETCKQMNVACKDCPVCSPGMSKADKVRVGQMVSWNSSGGRAKGKVKRIVRDGSYNVPDSDFTITGTPDNPAVVIEVYRDDKPTGRMVGHRMNTLRSVSKGVIQKMYSVVENHPGCTGGFAVVDEDGKMEGCFANREQAQAYANKETIEDEYEDKIDELKREQEMAEDAAMGKSLYVMENYIGCVGGYAVVDKSGAIHGCYKSLSEARNRASMSKSSAVWSDSAFSVKKI